MTGDIGGEQTVAALPPTPMQFFGALDAAFPDSTATVRAAVPSDPTNPINRAFNGTPFVTPGCALLAFVQSTLNLSDVQVSDLLADAPLQPK